MIHPPYTNTVRRNKKPSTKRTQSTVVYLGKKSDLREECILSQRNQSHRDYHGPARGSKRILELLENVVVLEVTHRLRLILKLLLCANPIRPMITVDLEYCCACERRLD